MAFIIPLHMFCSANKFNYVWVVVLRAFMHTSHYITPSLHPFSIKQADILDRRGDIGFLLAVNIQSLPMGLALYGLRRPKRTYMPPVPVLVPKTSVMCTKKGVDFTSMGTVYDSYTATKKRMCSSNQYELNAYVTERKCVGAHTGI